MNFEIGDVPNGWTRGDELQVVSPSGKAFGYVMHTTPMPITMVDMGNMSDHIAAISFHNTEVDKVNKWLRWWYKKMPLLEIYVGCKELREITREEACALLRKHRSHHVCDLIWRVDHLGRSQYMLHEIEQFDGVQCVYTHKYLPKSTEMWFDEVAEFKENISPGARAFLAKFLPAGPAQADVFLTPRMYTRKP